MKKLLLSAVAVLISTILFAQVKLYSDLNFRNGYAFYKNEPDEFTGKVLKTSSDKKAYYVTFKNGVQEGTVTIGNEEITYSNGYISEYKYTSPTGIEIVHLKNELTNKRISKIGVGTWFHDQKNDTIYFNETLKPTDTLTVLFGTILTKRNGTKLFIENNNVTLIGFVAWSKIGAYASYEQRVIGNRISYNFFYRVKTWRIFIEEVRIRMTNNSVHTIQSQNQQSAFQCVFP